MRWTWDDRKSDWTLQERGFDFAFAARLFDGRIIAQRSDRHGGPRWQAIGMIDGKHYAVVYTRRTMDGQRVRRIISARRARDNEQAAYDAQDK